MLSIPLYDTFLQRQYKDATRETKRIRTAIRFDFQFVTRFFIRKAIKKINFFLLTQVIESKGLLSDIESKKDALFGMDLSETIDSINKIIKLNISLKQILTEFSGNPHAKKYEVNSWDSILEETIDSLYSTLRILKRQNKKTRIETSSLALESSKCSLTSLQTATYDRRTT